MDAIRPWLYIGKYRDTLNRALLRSYNIQVLLQFAEQTIYPDIAHVYLPVEDGLPLEPALLRKLHLWNSTLITFSAGSDSGRLSFITVAVKPASEL